MSVSITLRPQSSAKGRSRPRTRPKTPFEAWDDVVGAWVAEIANRSLVVSGAHKGVSCGYPRRVGRCFDCQARPMSLRVTGEDLRPIVQSPLLFSLRGVACYIAEDRRDTHGARQAASWILA